MIAIVPHRATRALYSALEESRDVVACFFDFQDTKVAPKKTQNPVTDLGVVGQVVQSESENALR